MIPVPIQILGKDTIQTIDHVIHHTIEKGITQITEIEVIQTTELNVTKTIDQETIPTTDLIIKETITITIIGHETTHQIGIPNITIEEIILNPLIETTIVTLIPNTNIEKTHRNISDKLIRYKQLKKQLQIPLVQIPPESTEVQLNHINCESTDSESDTNHTISVNMITVENDYEPIIYEQPFSSHIYENQWELLQDYYTRPIRNDRSVEQNVNEINTVVNNEKQRSSTNHIYQNIQKDQPREKNWTIPFLLESLKSKEF